MNEQLSDFIAVREAVEAALVEAAAEPLARFRDDAINWGDLHCVRVERAVGWGCLDGDPTVLSSYWRVCIEEASPEAWHLRVYISEKLRERFGTVEVSIEW